jgi:hypothetical protein
MPAWSRISVLDQPGSPVQLADPLAMLEDVFVTMLMAPTEKPLSHILVLLLDDAQWVDVHTLSVLRKLKARPEGSDVLVLLSVRSHDETAEANLPLQAFFRDMYDRGGIEFHALEALSLAEVTLLIKSVIPGLVLPEPAAALIHRHSSGLPALVEEVVKLLVHRNYITCNERGLSINPIAEHDIPSNLSDLLFTGVKNLESEMIAIVSKAAVVGCHFDRESLLHVHTGLTDGHLHGILESAVQRGLLQEDVPGHYLFGSTEIHASFYTYLSEAERMGIHGEIATWLESQYDGADPQAAGRLALHWQAAGMPDRAEAILSAIFAREADPPASPVTSGEAPVPPEVLPAALKLVQGFRSAVANYRSFPPKSEVVVESQIQVLADISELLTYTEVLSLAVAQSDVMVNGKRLSGHRGAKRQPGDELTEALGDSGLKGLSFHRGLRLDEIHVLMEILGLTPMTLAAQGGWRAVAQARGMNNVNILEPSDTDAYVPGGGSTMRRLPNANATARRLPGVE